jgi:tRNA(fMet)-specific endonuclease VapC
MACLDTTLLLDLRGRGGKKLQARARQKVLELSGAGADLTTTIFNLAELWVGVEGADDSQAEQAAVALVVAPLRVLGFDQGAARMFGRLTAHLQRLGQPVGDMDVLIASVALEHGERIVTRNLKHFVGIPGLHVESY